ncbi:hypothetical protein IscW_ISCW007380 [Ixodes scapularis]|uniref:Uncharacterized protein n=1 Tax=Ixodes scapularis TaxID=6945 RepID=B7PUV8_IXOSC|nr:hypothetical protein IscW_ISCW007380 [Ixodes scapularis]|eukprot:XP_002406893.1 hypothetical protein IscW_ISCW007380 [Ixodes scapularis]
MIPYMSQVADIFVEILGEKADEGKEYPMLCLFQGLTMDYVGRAAFGFDCTFQRDLKHPFLRTAQSVLPGVMTGPFHFLARKKMEYLNTSVLLRNLETFFEGA